MLLEEIGSTGIGELTQPRLLLAPNPARDAVRVSSSNNAMIRTMTLTGADGRAIKLTRRHQRRETAYCCH